MSAKYPLTEVINAMIDIGAYPEGRWVSSAEIADKLKGDRGHISRVMSGVVCKDHAERRTRDDGLKQWRLIRSSTVVRIMNHRERDGTGNA